MSEPSDSDFDFFRKYGSESDPEVSPFSSFKSKENDPSTGSSASQVAGPSSAMEDSKDIRPLHHTVSFKDDILPNASESSKGAGPSQNVTSLKETGLSHVQESRGSAGHSGAILKVVREVSLQDQYQMSIDDRGKNERKEKHQSRDDTVLTLDESNPNLKDVLKQPKRPSNRSSSLTYDSYSKRFDSAYTSELFGSIVHHFRRSVTSTEVNNGSSKYSSLLNSISSPMLLSGELTRSSRYSEVEKNSFKKSVRISVFLDTEIGLNKDVTYNDYKGRIWITVISVTLWAIALTAYFFRIYGLRNAPVILKKSVATPE